MQSLIEGFQHFQHTIFPGQRALYEQIAAGQSPHTMIITCSDSRILLERIFSCEPGELFVYRNVGNIVPPYAQHVSGEVAAIEYAVEVLKVRHIVVCGHSDCGAMKALLHPNQISDKPSVAAWLKHADTARQVVRFRDHKGEDVLPQLIEENVVAQLDHLRTLPMVAARLVTGTLQIHGWVYDIAHAELKVFEPGVRSFAPIDSPAKLYPGASAAGRPIIAQA